MGCRRARSYIPFRHRCKLVASAAQVGKEDWEKYADPSKFEFLVVLAKERWFDHNRNGFDCSLGAGAGKGCPTDWAKGKGPRCVMKVVLSWASCNTCCCKDGEVKSSLQSSLYNWKNGGSTLGACGAWFGAVDALIRSFFSVVRGVV